MNKKHAGVKRVGLELPNLWFLDLLYQTSDFLYLLCFVEEKEHHMLFLSPSLFSRAR